MAFLSQLKLMGSALLGVLKEHRVPLLFLTLASLYFCHRLFGIYYPLEADAQQNLYYRFHHELMALDHNPFQWYYTSFLPFSGNHNPFTWVARHVISFFFFSDNGAARSILINMFSGWLGHWGICLSVYFFLILTGLTRWGAVLGSVVVSFTGFHLLGLRQFDHMYQLSMLAVPPTLWAIYQIAQHQHMFFWGTVFAFFTGFSLLSGSNMPLFVYMPLYFLFPLFVAKQKKTTQGLWKVYGVMLGASIVGVLGASIVLIPGMVYLPYTNRTELVFDSEQYASFYQVLLSMFFRDWWVNEFWPYYHIDFYLTLPVMVLFFAGLGPVWREKNPLGRFMLLLAVVGFIFINFPLVPEFLAEPIRWFFTKLSIRRPHRFFLLLLLPVGYVSARGFENSRKRWGAVIPVVVLFAILLVTGVVSNWKNILPDMKLSAAFSITLMVLTTLFIAMQIGAMSGKFKLALAARHKLRVLVIGGVYLSFLLAPIQMTQFAPAYLGRTQTPSVTLPESLGLGWYYSESMRRAEKVLLQPKPELNHPATRQGRVFLLDDAKHRDHEYYAPFTGHRFVFTRSGDPAGPKWMDELLLANNEAILDLMGVCWLLNSKGLYQREKCREEVLIMSGLRQFRSDKEILNWMRVAKTDEMLHQAAVNCNTQACPSASAPVRSLSQTDGYEILERTPGKFKVKTYFSKPGYLFLSTMYRFDWEARIGKTKVPVLRSHHAFMAVPVPAGENVVEVVLNPWVKQLSFVISSLVFLLLAYFMVKKLPRGALNYSMPAS